MLQIMKILTLFCAFGFSHILHAREMFIADMEKGNLVHLNEKGEVIWKTKVKNIHDLQLLENGNVLMQTDAWNVIEMTPNQEQTVVWQYDARSEPSNKNKRVEIHAFQRLASGDTMIAESGSARIIEVDAKNVIKKQIALQVKSPSTHSDTRMVRKLANEHYLVAHENDGCVREYDTEGKVVWEYAIPLFDQAEKGGHGPEGFGNRVFGVERLKNGNTLIGAGNGHAVLEVTPEKKVVWEVHQKDLEGITLAWVCGVKRLANGNTRFINCHAGAENPQVIEVDRDKKVVWTFHDFERFGNALTNVVVLPASSK